MKLNTINAFLLELKSGEKFFSALSVVVIIIIIIIIIIIVQYLFFFKLENMQVAS